jgi:hypothetical protein
MAVRKDKGPENAEPDRIPLTQIQAERLAAMTSLPVKDLVGVRPTDLADRIKWQLDPLLWGYRRVCGRVVKRDAVTGAEYGVPSATVHVEDTDCSLVLYSPVGSSYSWFYPFRCRREVIATVRTDACGRFCVWVPRWEIDWIRTWRLKRICFPVIFERPTWRDLVADLREPLVPAAVFGPDPTPWMFDATRVEHVARLGDAAARRLRSAGPMAFGESSEELMTIGHEDAFDENLQPPLPEELVNVVRDTRRGEHETAGLIQASLADRLGVDAKILASLDLRRVIGPFKRCVTVPVPVWAPIFDVPDITFRVTQDTDGDGDEETIYSEGYFQVRWNAGAIPNVTLRARAAAKESRICDAPPVLPCGNQPAINFAGLMPVTAAYHDNVTGYAIRSNRPRPLGVPTSPATAPYCLNVNLFGCLPSVPGAAKYRLVHRYATDSGGAFGGDIKFTNEQWTWHPTIGAPVPATLDPVEGWTSLPPANLAGTPEESFLFPFDTTRYAPGLYAIRVEIGDAAGNVLVSSPEVKFLCDNRAPVIPNQVRWSSNGGATWTVLPLDCPVVRRGATPVDVLFEVTWNVMAPAHYRDSSADASGCGASGPAPLLDPIGQTTSDWHTGPADNAMTYVLTYRLPSTHAEGTYSFGCHANSRAFNPSGYVAGYQTNDWLFDIGTPPIYDNRRVYFSVINA